MSRITTALTAGFSMMLPVTSPVLLGLTSAVGIGAEVLVTQTAHAQSAEDWYNSGMLKAKRGNLKGAIADWSKAIELSLIHISEPTRRS